MKTFDLYRHPTLGYEAVKRGFSWPGFLIGPIWAHSKRMWLGGAFLLVVWLFLFGAQSDAEAKGRTFSAQVMLVLQIGLALAAGMRGNSYWAQSLARRGFEHLGAGDTVEPDAAVAAFVKKTATDSTSPTPG